MLWIENYAEDLIPVDGKKLFIYPADVNDDDRQYQIIVQDQDGGVLIESFQQPFEATRAFRRLKRLMADNTKRMIQLDEWVNEEEEDSTSCM